MDATQQGSDLLTRSAFLRFLPAEYQSKLLPLFRRQRYEFGDLIVQEGDDADAFYLMALGRARVVKNTPSGQEISLRVLNPGDDFGESALLDGGKRNATVRCSTSVEVLRLAREDFLALLVELPEARHYVELVRRFRLLQGFLYEFSSFGRMPIGALRALVEKLTPVQANKGDCLVRQGDAAGPMFIVRKGRVRAYRSTDGHEYNLRFYREGDFFGELALLMGTPRTATVQALTNCELLSLSPESVRELRKEFPEFRKVIDERIALYDSGREARVPLDFREELLPADATAEDAVALDGESAPLDSGDDPFADEKGFFRKRARRIRRFAIVRQIDETDCGAACLAMICRHFGRKVSLAHTRRLCNTTSDGTSLKALCAAANDLGLAARALKVSLRNLPQLPLPAILHWEGNHWVVLLDVKDRRVRVADPALGIRSLPRAELEQRWTGYAALFDYTSAFEQAPEGRSTFAWLWPMLVKSRGPLLEALLLAVVVNVLQLLFPVLTQTVVDRVIVDHDHVLLKTVILAMSVALVFVQLSGLAQKFLLSFVAVRLDISILDFLTRRLLALPMSYFNSRRTGDIQRRLDGTTQLRVLAEHEGIAGVLALVTVAGCIGLMALYDPKLTAIFLATLPMNGALMWVSVRFLRPMLADIEESQGKYASHQIDAIKGIEAVKAAAAELVFRDTMLNEFMSISKKLLRSTFFIMSYDTAVQTIGLLSTMLFLWFGARMVMSGEITIGSFVAFNSLVAMAYAAILRVLGVWDQSQRAIVLVNRLQDVFDAEPEQGHDRSSLTPVAGIQGHIELRNVGFRYGGPESPQILSGINLEIVPGSSVAIVGRSGCGKTTLVKLISGLLEATEGSIRIDHLDLKTLKYRDVRRQIGFVLQENHMFSQSIRENIAFGDIEPDFERVLWAAQVANAHDFISRLPQGYETRIGESGLALSGGQRQRIAIARALYLDPPVLIFDEATSALDSESERAIQSNLGRMMAGRTSIVIAHRLSTVRDANLIVVLEQGRIVETGTHDQLMERRGLYFYLNSQQLGI